VKVDEDFYNMKRQYEKRLCIIDKFTLSYEEDLVPRIWGRVKLWLRP